MVQLKVSGAVQLWAVIVEQVMCCTGMGDCRICYGAVCNNRVFIVFVRKCIIIVNGNVYIIIVVPTLWCIVVLCVFMSVGWILCCSIF